MGGWVKLAAEHPADGRALPAGGAGAEVAPPVEPVEVLVPSDDLGVLGCDPEPAVSVDGLLHAATKTPNRTASAKSRVM